MCKGPETGRSLACSRTERHCGWSMACDMKGGGRGSRGRSPEGWGPGDCGKESGLPTRRGHSGSSGPSLLEVGEDLTLNITPLSVPQPNSEL